MNIRKNLFPERVVKHWNRLSRELVVTVPVNVEELYRCSAEGHGLADMIVICQWLD